MRRYQVFQVKAKDKASFGELVKLWKEQSSTYDFWTEPRQIDRPLDIMVPPAFAGSFVNLLQTHGMDYRVKMADVQS